MDVVDEAMRLLLIAVCDLEEKPTEDELSNAIIGIMQLKKWKDQHERRGIPRSGEGYGS